MKAVRTSGALILAGLGIEAVSLHWTHPLAFILFAACGAASIGAGVLTYLGWLLFRRTHSHSEASQ